MANQVNVTNAPNIVAVSNPTVSVIPEIVQHTVTLGGKTTTVNVATQNVTVRSVENPVAVSVQSATIGVVSGGVQGPEGAQGPTGPQGPTSGDEITVLNKTERKDIVEDVPSTGDLTIYYGVANPQSATSSPVWLITRQVFLADGEFFDSDKKFASPNYDQIWDNRLGLTYT